jgi:nicotinic acid phosphoribosyltransferase
MNGTEKAIVAAMLSGEEPSFLMTDGYKFSMGQAGFPLRRETFYLSFRRPGRYYVPVDLAAVIAGLKPRFPASMTYALSLLHYLENFGYGLTPAMVRAIDGEVTVAAAPKGSWVREREPILSITGPSFLASWYEPLAIWLHYPIQVATDALLEGRTQFPVTCEEEGAIVRAVLEAIGVEGAAVADPEGYEARVRRNAAALVEAAGGDAGRILEVGMRGASCLRMHEIALQGCRAAGIRATSDVHLAWKGVMTPVGTTGHEHQQRWGGDLEAFRAIRDTRPVAPGYLFDTFDAVKRGIPAAVQAMREAPGRAASVRFDSGDRAAQFRLLHEAEGRWGVRPTYIFMDSIDAAAVREFEALGEQLGVPAARRLYGAGGFLVGRPAATPLVRDRVSAVYKLSESNGRPVMKLSVEAKRSLPGRPVIFRRLRGEPIDLRFAGCAGVIGQAGEQPPEGFARLGERAAAEYELEGRVEPSVETAALVEKISAEQGG